MGADSTSGIDMPVSNVIVVGGGFAGLACALACAQAGARVRVFEASPVRGRTPGHVDIVPNLLRDLASLGVAEQGIRRGFAYSGVDVVDEQGETKLRLDTPRLAGDRLPAAVGIAYDELLDILEGSALAAGAELRMGLRIEGVRPESGTVVGNGEAFGADLVVLADGAGSALVKSLFTGRRRRRGSTHAWWHALVPRPHHLDRLTWMAGTRGRRLVLVPVGMSLAGIAIARTADVPIGVDGAALARTLAGWGKLPRRIAALVGPNTPTALRFAGGAFLEAPWHAGAVLCVGSAARSNAPAFGQSAAQGVEDALVLGELVATGIERQELLAKFMARRWHRARRVHELVELAARWIEQPEAATDLMSLSRELHGLVAQPA